MIQISSLKAGSRDVPGSLVVDFAFQCRERELHSGCWPLVGGAGNTCPKAISPPTTSGQLGKSFSRQVEGAMDINSTVSSDSHLEIGPEWSDQRHSDCFKYN